METESMMMEVLKQYQRKYSTIIEIHRLTEELGQLLSKNDQVSAQLVLGMRQDEMNKADKCSADLAVLEDVMSPDERRRIDQILDEKDHLATAETPQERKLVEIDQHIRQTLRRTAELDERISSRIAGKDSFYSKKR